MRPKSRPVLSPALRRWRSIRRSACRRNDFDARSDQTRWRLGSPSQAASAKTQTTSPRPSRPGSCRSGRPGGGRRRGGRRRPFPSAWQPPGSDGAGAGLDRGGVLVRPAAGSGLLGTSAKAARTPCCLKDRSGRLRHEMPVRAAGRRRWRNGRFSTAAAPGPEALPGGGPAAGHRAGVGPCRPAVVAPLGWRQCDTLTRSARHQRTRRLEQFSVGRSRCRSKGASEPRPRSASAAGAVHGTRPGRILGFPPARERRAARPRF